MIEKALFGIWGAWLLLVLVAAFRVFAFPMARRHQERLWRKRNQQPRRVALILSVKGFELQSTPRFFDTIFAQDYADYRVIVAFESWSDPVAMWLCEHLELGPKRPVWIHPDPGTGPRSITLVCGGLSEDEGQKVHNQRAAFAELQEDDEIIAFADSDILCGTDWLTRLVAPITSGTHHLATTYRWLVPKRPTLPNQVACTINASITTQGGSDWSTVLWGGSMAMSREVFQAIDAPNLLAGSLNDDLRLSKAARKKKYRIAFVRSLILPTTIDFTWGRFFEFVRRQYTQIKFFSPILYTGVNFVLGFYMLGALTVVGALIYGYFYAWVPVAAAYVIDQFRALARQQVYLSLFPDTGTRQKLFAASWLEHMLTPFWMALHWLLLFSTWTQNRITWAGIRYHILSPSKTKVLQRTSAPAALPAGAPGLAMVGALNDLRRSRPIPAHRSVSTPAVSPTVDLPPVVEEAKRVESPTVPSPVIATAPQPRTESVPLAHPGGISAILPLTLSYHEPRARVKRRIIRPRGPAISSVEAALQKTRIRPARLFTRVEASPSRSEIMVAAAPLLPIRQPLTRVQQCLQKARSQQTFPVAREDRLEPIRQLVPPPGPKFYPVPAIVQRASASDALAAPSASMAPNGSRPVGGRITSLAAHRAVPGGAHRGYAPLKLTPAMSARTAPGSHPPGVLRARPVSRGASARP